MKLIFRENKYNFRDRNVRQKRIENNLRRSILQKYLTGWLSCAKRFNETFDRALNTGSVRSASEKIHGIIKKEKCYFY